MFETNEEILQRIGIFAVIGFFLGFGYDILRFFRILFKKGRAAVNVEDLLYLPFCALVLFYCIVEYGGGTLRLYFFPAAAFGAAVYLALPGRLTKYSAKWIRRFCLWAARLIRKPFSIIYHLFQQFFTRIFGTLCQKITGAAKKLRFYLKKRAEMLYNKSNSKMGKLCGKDSEERHVIKAEVRKKA